MLLHNKRTQGGGRFCSSFFAPLSLSCLRQLIVHLVSESSQVTSKEWARGHRFWKRISQCGATSHSEPDPWLSLLLNGLRGLRASHVVTFLGYFSPLVPDSFAKLEDIEISLLLFCIKGWPSTRYEDEEACFPLNTPHRYNFPRNPAKISVKQWIQGHHGIVKP